MDHFPDPFASLYPLHEHAQHPSFWLALANGTLGVGKEVLKAMIGGAVVLAIGYFALIPQMRDNIADLRADVAVLKNRAEINATVNAQQTREMELRTRQQDAELTALGRKLDEVEKEMHAHEVLDNRRLGR